MQIDKIPGRHILFILMTFCAYFALSTAITLQGAIAPVMMAYFGITAAQQGLIMTMLSVGRLGSAVYLGLEGEKYNKIHALAFGLGILCLICIAIGFLPVYALLLLLATIMGIGIAFADIMTNGVVSEVYPNQKKTLLSLVNAFFSAGALLAPVMVTLTANPAIPESFGKPFLILGVLTAVILLLLLLSGKRIMAETPYKNMEAMKKRVAGNPAEIFKTKKAWFLLLIGTLYLTFLFGLIMWLPSYAIYSLDVDFHTGELMVTAFFAGTLPMRFLGPFFLQRFSPRFLYSVFGCVAAALMFIALFTNNIPAIFVLVTASGFVQGCSVAVFLVMCTDAFPARTASASSLFSLSCGAASLSAPLWMGAMSAYTGFRLPMVLICVALILSSCLVGLLPRLELNIPDK